LSAAFIAAANSWMQHPVGYILSPSTHQPQLNDIWALLTNPVFFWGYAKVLLASLVTGAAMMLAVSAWQLRHGKDRAVFTRLARLALIVLLPAILFTMLVGDELGVTEARYQPMVTGVTLVLICALHGATFLCLRITGEIRERAWSLARRVAPLTTAAVFAFVSWTHVASASRFFLNPVELLAVLAVQPRSGWSTTAARASRSPRPRS
jgi:cytochrome bd-type quinol oxidase subunit 2